MINPELSKYSNDLIKLALMNYAGVNDSEFIRLNNLYNATYEKEKQGLFELLKKGKYLDVEYNGSEVYNEENGEMEWRNSKGELDEKKVENIAVSKTGVELLNSILLVSESAERAYVEKERKRTKTVAWVGAISGGLSALYVLWQLICRS